MKTTVFDYAPVAGGSVLRDYFMDEIYNILDGLPEEFRYPILEQSIDQIPAFDPINVWDVKNAISGLKQLNREMIFEDRAFYVQKIDRFLDDMYEILLEVDRLANYSSISHRAIKEDCKLDTLEFLKQELINNGFVDERDIEQFLEPEE